MKKILQFIFLIAVLMLSFSINVDAQTYGGKKKKKKKKKEKTEKNDDYFDDRGSFTDRLWYGADFTLGFSGIQGGNLLQTGIAPMVGYKITDNLSAGPRLDILYSGYRFNNGVDDAKLNSTDFGVGAFARYKILDIYFLQLEYQSLSSEVPLYNQFGQLVFKDGSTTDLDTRRFRDDHYYIGGGYSGSSGAIGFQASLLWDLSQEFSSSNIPLSYRIGINYKF